MIIVDSLLQLFIYHFYFGQSFNEALLLRNMDHPPSSLSLASVSHARASFPGPSEVPTAIPKATSSNPSGFANPPPFPSREV